MSDDIEEEILGLKKAVDLLEDECPPVLIKMLNARRSALMESMFPKTVAPTHVYTHVLPQQDSPEEHGEMDCSCRPYVDEETGRVFHRYLSGKMLNASQFPAPETMSIKDLVPSPQGHGWWVETLEGLRFFYYAGEFFEGRWT